MYIFSHTHIYIYMIYSQISSSHVLYFSPICRLLIDLPQQGVVVERQGQDHGPRQVFGLQRLARRSARLWSAHWIELTGKSRGNHGTMMFSPIR